MKESEQQLLLRSAFLPRVEWSVYQRCKFPQKETTGSRKYIVSGCELRAHFEELEVSLGEHLLISLGLRGELFFVLGEKVVQISLMSRVVEILNLLGKWVFIFH